MQIQFHIRGLDISPAFRRRFEPPLERLQNLISITAAAVVLEHRRDDLPPFRAYASLAVPGPDIHAEARDHTLEAAWLKVATALRRQIEQRNEYCLVVDGQWRPDAQAPETVPNPFGGLNSIRRVANGG